MRIGHAMTDEAFEKESQLVTRLTDALAHCVVPLFAEGSDGKPRLVGTGVLVSSGDDSYLMSAAHAFDEIQEGRQLFFYIEPQTIRRLSGVLRTTKKPKGTDRKGDRLDVGVLLLQDPSLPPYPAVGKRCLPVTAVVPHALPRQGKHYLITGFPGSKSRPNPVAREVSSKVYGLWNISAPAEQYGALGLSQSNHIAVRFDRKRSVFPNKQVQTFPRPAGMSGAPVWLLYDESGPNDPSQTPLVGIAIEHHTSGHVLVATDIAVALDLIARFGPRR